MSISFASGVKTELCFHNLKKCCAFAQCYGMMLFAKRFSAANISIQTENSDVAECFAKLCAYCFDARTRIIKGGVKKAVYVVSVISPNDRKKIMIAYGATDGKRPFNINGGVILKECCKSAFLRGAFLTCGGISNPEKGYHARFLVKDRALADEFLSFLEKCSVPAKSYQKNGSYNLYYKDSRLIEDLLAYMNATKKTLELMDAGIIKTVKNKLNRQDNCIMANMDKTINASLIQQNAIKKLKENGDFATLSPELQEVAVARLNNPHSSLADLCAVFDPPLSKSALSRKLKKIVDMANED